MKTTVETKDFFGLMKGLDESVHPECFLRQTKLTKPDKKILKLVKKKVAKSSVDFCHYLNQRVSSSIKYVSGTTDIHSSAVDAISQGYDFSFTSMIKGVKTNYNGTELLDYQLSVQAETPQ